MKQLKSITAIIAILLCGGCGETSYDKQPTIYRDGEMYDLKLYVIDSCEYIGKLRGGNSDVITHKGNCKNPMHDKRKTIIYDTVLVMRINEAKSEKQ